MTDSRIRYSRLGALVAALALAACSSMGMQGMSMTDMPAKKAADGTLTNASGMTLYTFDKDAMGKSNCDEACLKKWPAFHAAAKAKAEGEWTLVKAADGKEMWAYEGKPLYTFAGDKKPGDMTGDGVGGVWHVAK